MLFVCAICATMNCGGARGACGHGGFGGGGFSGGGFGGGYAAAGGGSRPVQKVKVVKNEHGGEKWVIVENHETIYENVTQPDPNRQALIGVATAAKLGGIRYTYGDELPKKINQATVCAVVCSILATPLVLICIIPLILKLKKVCLVL